MNNIEITNVSKNHFSGEKHLYKYSLRADEGMMIFVSNGSGKAKLNKMQFAFAKDTVILCFGDDLLCYKCAKSVDTDLFTVRFSIKDTAAFKSEYNLKSNAFRIYNIIAFTDCFERLYLSYIHKSHFQSKNCSALFYELLFLALNSQKKESVTDSVISELAENIHRNFIHGEIDVSLYADRVGLSKDRLSVIFKNKYFLPPYKYQLMLKMNEATQMLLHTELPIGRISEILGFSSQLYFSNAYKKQMGKAPSEVRKEH